MYESVNYIIFKKLSRKEDAGLDPSTITFIASSKLDSGEIHTYNETK